MFLGQYHYFFDDRGNLLIPERYRAHLADGAVVTRGFDRNLMVLTTTAFEEIYSLIIALNIADPLARYLLRMILGNASQLMMDETNRIDLPKDLRGFAGLENEAVLVGQGDYFEVWSPASWTLQEAFLQDVEANAQRFVTLNLARHS